MKFKNFLFFALIICCINQPLSAKKKTIHVIPDNAKIYVNGDEVGSGMYEVDFGRKDDFVMLKFTAPGYIDRTVKLFKKNPQNTLSYELYLDEAEKNSVGASEGVDIANKYFTVTCKEGLTEDEVWKRLMNIAINNFENVEIRDKSAGWIRTAWVNTNFAYQVVRTKLEIRLQFTGEDELAYRVRLSSEMAYKDGGLDENSFEQYDRILKKYEMVITELQTSLGTAF